MCQASRLLAKGFFPLKDIDFIIAGNGFNIVSLKEIITAEAHRSQSNFSLCFPLKRRKT